MDKDKFIFIIFVILAICAYIICIKDFIGSVINKFKVKVCRESIITVSIDNKCHFPGLSYSAGVNTLGARPKYPDTYMIYCSDENGITYFINDKEIFNNYDLGDMIKLKLVEKLGRNNEVISYEVKKFQ